MGKLIRLTTLDNLPEARRNALAEQINQYRKKVAWPKKCEKCDDDLCENCKNDLFKFLKENPRKIVSLLQGEGGFISKMLEPAEVAEFIIALGTLPPLYYDPENVRELKRIAKCVFDLVEIAPTKRSAAEDHIKWADRSSIISAVFDLLNIPLLDDVNSICAGLARAGFEQWNYEEDGGHYVSQWVGKKGLWDTVPYLPACKYWGLMIFEDLPKTYDHWFYDDNQQIELFFDSHRCFLEWNGHNLDDPHDPDNYCEILG